MQNYFYNSKIISITVSIIIPTVFREDYLGALRQLTRRQESDTFIRMLQRAQQFSATIVGEDMGAMQALLEASNACKEGDQHILRFINT